MPATDRPQSRRAALLEFSVLGLLHDSPLHGYELRKRLTTALGIFRALSYGSLYPALRHLVEAGWIHETSEPTSGAKRARITYELTAEGKERFQDLVATPGPDAWDDDDFDVRLAFFSRTEAQVRLRILEGRRSRLEERLANIREASARNRERMDTYTLALQSHGQERAEREVRWLEELITAERHSISDPGPAAYDPSHGLVEPLDPAGPAGPADHPNHHRPQSTQQNNKE